MHYKRKSLLGASLLTLLCAWTLAQAGDNYDTNRLIMTGAQCQPSTGSQWPDFLVNPDGIRNNSTSSRYISCSIPIDADELIDQADSDLTTGPGYFILELGFDYSLAQVAPIATVCTLYRRTYAGVKTTSTLTVTSGRTPGIVTNFAQPSMMTGFDPFNPDTFSFNCRLPAKVKLLYIKRYEAEATGGYYYTP